MKRTLKELIAIANELKAAYTSYQTAATDGRITLDEGLALAGDVIAILNKHNVTLAELQELLGEVKPVLELLNAVQK